MEFETCQDCRGLGGSYTMTGSGGQRVFNYCFICKGLGKIPKK
jgi:hypothetical protein